MVRETRYLFVGNLPEKVTEDEVFEHFKRYGKIQSVKFHDKKEDEEGISATVAFGDIKSASKAHNSENTIDSKSLVTAYSEGSATGSAVTRTRQEPVPRAPAFTPHTRPTPYTNRPKGAEEGETYDNRDYYSSGAGTRDPAQFENRFPPPFNENGQNQTRGRPRERFFRGGFKGNHNQRQFGSRHMEGHRSFDHSPMETRDAAFDRPKTQPSPTHSTSRSSRHSSTRKQRSSRSNSRSRSNSSSSSSYSRSSSGSSDSGSDSHSSRSSGRSSPRHHQIPSAAIIPPQAKSHRTESQDSSASDKSTERDPLDKRPHGICITALPLRSSDTSLRDGLFHEYKKYGKVNAVQVAGSNDDRYAIVSFKKAEDAEKAYEASLDKTFFGARIKVQVHEGIADTEDNEFRPPEAELDEYHPKATRTLFVGNLEKDITTQELRDRFGEYGEIIVI
ncbi:Protein split end [Mizuhopecten yessoensis]|uniref:Protein split end n=1 Tax=Mizuhopecten yessoensis TaxID=6573 RepID=A0A210Q5Q0_MIZYE|nr:Protein split end [Mizuhopecten yessoensis]